MRLSLGFGGPKNHLKFTRLLWSGRILKPSRNNHSYSSLLLSTLHLLQDRLMYWDMEIIGTKQQDKKHVR